MKVRLVFVPPGGGEADYMLDFEMPSIPQAGDYISVQRPDDPTYTSDFIVRRTWWRLSFPNNDLYGDATSPVYGSVANVAIECEFARGAMSKDEHKKSCDGYEGRNGRKVPTFDTSMY